EGGAAEQLQVESHVDRAVLLPLQIRIPDRGLAVAGDHARVGPADVVEGTGDGATVATHRAPRRDVLVPRDPPAGAEHQVGDHWVIGKEGFLRNAPTTANGGERPPATRFTPAGGPGGPQRSPPLVPAAAGAVDPPRA